ncbi:MAG: hypothetical protein KatS3mg108_0904 [Isosphaeraceae bacterium]|jgi:hypothetical protein|nr:MAG: hypothetical protein KatS3mg108_0904 [Isosphaeraceae bacterium]
MSQRGSLRRGALLLEAAVGCVVLTLAVAGLAGLVAILARQRELLDGRERAGVIAANLLERLTADRETLSVGDREIEIEQADGRPGTPMRARLVVSEEPLDGEAVGGGPRWLALRLTLSWLNPGGVAESLEVVTWCAGAAGSRP